MDDTAPAYRASLTKALLERVEQLEPAERDRVYAHLADGQRQAIAEASRTEWLPAELERAIDEAVYEGLGRDRLVAFMRQYAADAGEIPLFAPLLRGALNLFGDGPRAILRMVPRTWGFVARNCGEVKLTIHDDHVELAYVDLPEVMRTPFFAAGCEGSVRGVLDLVGQGEDVRIEVDLHDLAQGTVRLSIYTGS